MKGRSGSVGKHGTPDSEVSEDNHGVRALKGSEAHKNLSWPGKKRGGKVEGDKPRPRLDRKHYAKGGAVKKGKTTVNVIIAPQDGQSPAAGGSAGQPPMPPAPPPAAPAPPRPPMPPMGGPPPGGAGMAPGMPMPRKSGGRVNYPIKDGAGGAKGRLEKVKAYGDESKKAKPSD